MAAKVPAGRIAIESEKDLKKHAVSILRRIKVTRFRFPQC